MGKITFILGGSRSGKSTHALNLAANKKVAFIATSQGLDKEMTERIRLHRQVRPKHWVTFEEPYEISKAILKINNKFEAIIIDCLTLLVSNLILKKMSSGDIEQEIARALELLKKGKARGIIVSNEVGSGIVPQNRLGRQFRDIAGRINQQVASGADEAIFMVSGIPLVLKKK